MNVAIIFTATDSFIPQKFISDKVTNNTPAIKGRNAKFIEKSVAKYSLNPKETAVADTAPAKTNIQPVINENDFELNAFFVYRYYDDSFGNLLESSQ